jgi:hypothetical protein
MSYNRSREVRISAIAQEAKPMAKIPFRSILSFPAALALVLLITGCGGSGGNAGGSSTAMLRVVNGIWGNPVSVTINGVSAGDVPYTSCVSEVCTTLSGYTTVKSGGLTISIAEQDSTTDILPTQLQNLNLAANSRNSLVVYARIPPTERTRSLFRMTMSLRQIQSR